MLPSLLSPVYKMSAIFSASLELTPVFDKHLSAGVTAFTTKVVDALADKYGFSRTEALECVGLEQVQITRGVTKQPKAAKVTTPKIAVPRIPIPFCGHVVDGWCKAIKVNHRLYTQCSNQPLADGEFCKTCAKNVKDGVPQHGHINDRLSGDPLAYTDPKGNKVKPYGNILEELNISREDAVAEAEKFGLIIPEEQFQIIKGKRGRPKGSGKKVDTCDTSSDTSSEDAGEKVKKKRGRPKKVIEETSTDNGSSGDLIALMLKEAEEKDAKSSSFKDTNVKVKKIK